MRPPPIYVGGQKMLYLCFPPSSPRGEEKNPPPPLARRGGVSPPAGRPSPSLGGFLLAHSICPPGGCSSNVLRRGEGFSPICVKIFPRCRPFFPMLGGLFGPRRSLSQKSGPWVKGLGVLWVPLKGSECSLKIRLVKLNSPFPVWVIGVSWLPNPKEMIAKYRIVDSTPDDGKSDPVPSPMIIPTPLMVVSTLHTYCLGDMIWKDIAKMVSKMMGEGVADVIFPLQLIQ